MLQQINVIYEWKSCGAPTSVNDSIGQSNATDHDKQHQINSSQMFWANPILLKVKVGIYENFIKSYRGWIPGLGFDLYMKNLA